MLRLWDIEINDGSGSIVSEKELTLTHDIWDACRDMLKECDKCTNSAPMLIPIKDEADRLIAYGYQDNEANRELRMLKELKGNKHAIQFTDIFPEYREVVLCGCNELAIAFAEYLKELGIAVTVIGWYWDYLGYQTAYHVNRRGGLILYAEGIPSPDDSLYDRMKRSVSSEFECIDQIYEANVLAGRITDTIGSFAEMIHKLKDEQEIVILGDGREAQDTYDLLQEHGVDIYGFALEKKEQREELLGKKVMGIADAMDCLERPVFINCKDTQGALGGEWTEYFDYRGYERNRQLFLIKDYIEIPDSNLIHIFRGRNVLLTGDEKLCQLLSDYLNLMEHGDVKVKYIELTDHVLVEKDDILCLVVPDYYNGQNKIQIQNRNILKQRLREMGFVNYTEYFISSRAFALIDKVLHEGCEKYTVPELTPKGMLLGRIPGSSGNYFFRGIMDGHPEVLMISSYCDFGHNLFYYCIRLANIDSDQILSAFWAMYNQEACEQERGFPNPGKFETCAEKLLKLKKRFTSQELFVLFHIAYAEMLNGKPIKDISAMVVYWEPHLLSRNEFPFFALWLEDKKVNGNTLVLRRNNISITGSNCARKTDGWNCASVYPKMFVDESLWDGVHLQYRHWREFKMRFEEIKLNPKKSLSEICSRMNIGWSDNMLKTTCAGEQWAYRGSVDFELKPVFNKYEEFFTEFDRFRISIASSPYQKKYGFSYENCLKFSRRELQELFLKPFLFEEMNLFERTKENISIYEWMRWELWTIRKHMVLDDIRCEFPMFEIKSAKEEDMLERNQQEIDKMLEFVRSHNKMILYGTGYNCRQLLKLMDEKTKAKVLFSDKRAETQPYYFCRKKVISPLELVDIFEDYSILVTSCLYSEDIKKEFDDMGIDSSRVLYNQVELRYR